ncbi:MAG: class I SAM-dependent methyltransferase [Hyphomicrobiales bacterium]|nr:class I SAM-dependent methyltransferase [Hyphomicrobiales bacterium]
MQQAKSFYDNAYRSEGFAAQRMYPNEELLRFFGTYYFPLAASERARLRVLEVGCGSGANLWMVAREGFEAHGMDLSAEGLSLCEQMLAKWQTSATLTQGDMSALRYQDHHFDVVLDVFASYCLPEPAFAAFLDEVGRVLKPGGRFFCYAPSKGSEAFRDPGPARRIDASTLDGIRRPTSPYFPQDYPFRFVSPAELDAMFADRGFVVLRNERIGRTYSNQAEYFEFVSVHAQKLSA